MGTYAILLLLVITMALAIVIFLKVNEILRELRTPVVKKLNPEFNKQGRRVNMQDSRPGQNRDNRPPQNPQRSQAPAGVTATAPRPLQANAPTEQNRDNREGRDNRGDRDRNSRDGRGDRNGRDRDRNSRDGRGDRNGRDRDRNRRPQEMMGNDSADFATQLPVEPTVLTGTLDTPLSRPQSEGRPAFEARRPLESRISEPVVRENTAAPVTDVSSEAGHSEGGDYDSSRMRHGRRPVVRKVPGLEPESPAAPTTPANG
jgi:hypothetical protein